MIILSANRLSKVYGTDVILQDVSFHVNAGDRVGIVGRNGAEAVLDIPLSEEELAQLQRSANTMREMIDKLDG